jgi:hypothetical protein
VEGALPGAGLPRFVSPRRFAAGLMLPHLPTHPPTRSLRPQHSFQVARTYQARTAFHRTPAQPSSSPWACSCRPSSTSRSWCVVVLAHAYLPVEAWLILLSLPLTTTGPRDVKVLWPTGMPYPPPPSHALRCAQLIAAVNGPAVGIGTTLLPHCDVVYCTPSAYFWTPFTRIAVVPEFCSSLLFPEIMGPSVANEVWGSGVEC